MPLSKKIKTNMGNFWNTNVIESKAKQNKTAKLVAYKKYCNKIINLLKISRQFDYQICFKRNKNNSKIL